MPTAQGLTTSGGATTSAAASDSSSAAGYFKNLLSGNRTAALQSVAPGANAAQTQADAAKRTASSMGTARGGGTAGTNQQIDSNTMASIQNALFGVKSGAATSLNQTAGTEGAIGGSQLSAGANLLNVGSNAAANEGGIGLKQEQLNSQELFQSLLGDVLGFGAFKGLFGGNGGGGGGGSDPDDRESIRANSRQ